MGKTYPPVTLLHMSQYVRTRSIEIFCLFPSPLPRHCVVLFISQTFATKSGFIAEQTAERHASASASYTRIKLDYAAT
jgi:hypothetical protein